MNIIWSDLAIKDLNDIEDYIVKDNPTRAVSFINELIDMGDSLSIEGEAGKGTPAKWIRDGNVRELYYKNYMLAISIVANIFVKVTFGVTDSLSFFPTTFWL